MARKIKTMSSSTTEFIFSAILFMLLRPSPPPPSTACMLQCDAVVHNLERIRTTVSSLCICNIIFCLAFRRSSRTLTVHAAFLFQFSVLPLFHFFILYFFVYLHSILRHGFPRIHQPATTSAYALYTLCVRLLYKFACVLILIAHTFHQYDAQAMRAPSDCCKVEQNRGFATDLHTIYFQFTAQYAHTESLRIRGMVLWIPAGNRRRS